MSEVMSLEMPGLEDVQEEALLDSGSYDLEIVSARQNMISFTDKESGEEVEREVVNIALVAQGESDRQAVYHTLWLPGEFDSPEEVIKAQRNMKRFISIFGIESKKGVLQYSDFLGKTAHLNVKQKNDKQGEPRVNVQIPRF